MIKKDLIIDDEKYLFIKKFLLNGVSASPSYSQSYERIPNIIKKIDNECTYHTLKIINFLSKRLLPYIKNKNLNNNQIEIVILLISWLKIREVNIIKKIYANRNIKAFELRGNGYIINNYIQKSCDESIYLLLYIMYILPDLSSKTKLIVDKRNFINSIYSLTLNIIESIYIYNVLCASETFKKIKSTKGNIEKDIGLLLCYKLKNSKTGIENSDFMIFFNNIKKYLYIGRKDSTLKKKKLLSKLKEKIIKTKNANFLFKVQDITLNPITKKTFKNFDLKRYLDCVYKMKNWYILTDMDDKEINTNKLVYDNEKEYLHEKVKINIKSAIIYNYYKSNNFSNVIYYETLIKRMNKNSIRDIRTDLNKMISSKFLSENDIEIINIYLTKYLKNDPLSFLGCLPYVEKLVREIIKKNHPELLINLNNDDFDTLSLSSLINNNESELRSVLGEKLDYLKFIADKKHLNMKNKYSHALFDDLNDLKMNAHLLFVCIIKLFFKP